MRSTDVFAVTFQFVYATPAFILGFFVPCCLSIILTSQDVGNGFILYAYVALIAPLCFTRHHCARDIIELSKPRWRTGFKHQAAPDWTASGGTWLCWHVEFSTHDCETQARTSWYEKRANETQCFSRFNLNSLLITLFLAYICLGATTEICKRTRPISTALSYNSQWGPEESDTTQQETQQWTSAHTTAHDIKIKMTCKHERVYHHHDSR